MLVLQDCMNIKRQSKTIINNIHINFAHEAAKQFVTKLLHYFSKITKSSAQYNITLDKMYSRTGMNILQQTKILHGVTTVVVLLNIKSLL